MSPGPLGINKGLGLLGMAHEQERERESWHRLSSPLFSLAAISVLPHKMSELNKAPSATLCDSCAVLRLFQFGLARLGKATWLCCHNVIRCSALVFHRGGMRNAIPCGFNVGEKLQGKLQNLQ